MTTQDLYRVLLKVLGVYFFINYILSNFTGFYYGYIDNDSLSQSFVSLISIAVTLFLFYQLIFKTDSLIRILKLTSNHDSEEVKTDKVTSIDLFNVILVFIGVSLVVHNTITMLSQVYYLLELYIPNKVPTIVSKNYSFYSISYSGLSIVFGLFITQNASKLALWLNKKTNHNQ
ncbi:MAG: hypothetical protein KC517_12160 [Bacteroidetes bacterium]|nr:hypothetical protein [Bacteroidota bacterium]